jgi:hypothetical protein
MSNWRRKHSDYKLANSNETEVFRLTPTVGKSYYHAEATRKMIDKDNWQDTKYFTDNELTFVGLFVAHKSEGYHDNAHHWDIFDNDGIEVIVHYSYEGNTCFIEAD